jgi:hypothetical protein
MRCPRLRLLSVVVASVSVFILTAVSVGVHGADARAVSSKGKGQEVVTKFPKAIQEVSGELELYGTISEVDKKGVVLSITKVDKQYPGNQFTAGQPYFGDVQKDDPEAWLLKKAVRLLWQKDGFDNDKAKELYATNKSHYKAGQSLRILSKWSKEDSGLIVKGATWFGGVGKRGAAKRGG